MRAGRGCVCVNIDATASASTSAGPGSDARAGRVGGCVDTVSVVSSIRPAGVEIVWPWYGPDETLQCRRFYDPGRWLQDGE